MSFDILVADLGGTNARFGLAAVQDGTVELSNVQSFKAERFVTIADAAQFYMASLQEVPQRACFAVAAPLRDGDVQFLNAAWSFNVERTRQALASGIFHLPSSYLETVRPGKEDDNAPSLVIGPGTGLGQAFSVPCASGGRHVVPTEGGHVTVAPYNHAEAEVVNYLARDYGRVSVERLLSGPGLVNIYRALCAVSDAPYAGQDAQDVTQAADYQSDPLAIKTVDIFCAVLGDVVGDAALCVGARGGVYLGGGILPKIKDVFLSSAFEARFLDKGRMRAHLEDVPIHLILGGEAALYGAAVFSSP